MRGLEELEPGKDIPFPRPEFVRIGTFRNQYLPPPGK
jgi:hypothetical protein